MSDIQYCLFFVQMRKTPLQLDHRSAAKLLSLLSFAGNSLSKQQVPIKGVILLCSISHGTPKGALSVIVNNIFPKKPS